MAEINLERAIEEANLSDEKIDPSVISAGEVTTAKRKSSMKRRRSAARHMLKSFVEEDGRNALEYVLWDIVMPNVKTLIHDIMDKGSARMLWGDDSVGGNSRYNYNQRNYTSYSSSNIRSLETRPIGNGSSQYRRSRSSFFVDDIYVETMSEAEDIESRMYYLVKKKGFALVSDFYEAAGLDSNYMDSKWGWYDLRGMKKIRGKDGVWIIEMPLPEEIEETR